MVRMMHIITDATPPLNPEEIVKLQLAQQQQQQQQQQRKKKKKEGMVEKMLQDLHAKHLSIL